MISLNLEKIEAFARKAHAGQKRKIGGEDFIEHPKRIADSLESPNLKAIAWLHDVLEETDHKLGTICAELGLDDSIRWSVLVLTKRKSETYFDYIMRVVVDKMARTVKIADLEDNMRDLEEGSMKDKYRFAHHFLLHWRPNA
jgi:(p)ppGpp synthase/HD superfamily hydrolase